jgi:hypothetical protein
MRDGANIFEIIHDNIRSDALETGKHVHAVTLCAAVVSNRSSFTEIVIDMHRN